MNIKDFLSSVCNEIKYKPARVPIYEELDAHIQEVSIKLMLNAKLTRNMYGKLLIIGLSSLYILQFAINILMNINLGIETNVNLPFVSDQGIYFVINSVCLAVILSIYRKKNIDNCEKIAA